ncbi:MAG: YfhO family protein, partial [Gemmatimonadaceae bacterium]
ATQAVHDPFLWGDGLMIHQIRSVLGYHGNELGRYQRLGEKESQWRQIANPSFWRLMNVRYVLTNTADLGIPALKKLMGPIRNSAGTDTYLFELPEKNPFAWVTPVIVKANDDAVLATVLDPRFDVRSAALFDSASTAVGKTIEQLPPPLTISVRTASYAPGKISLELSEPAPEGSALVVSENYYPGWNATIDGKPATASRADMTLIGVPLSAGARRVELSFSSSVYEQGKTITLLAIGLSLIAWIAGILMGRKRSV